LAIDTSFRARSPWSSSHAACITKSRPIWDAVSDVAELDLHTLAVGQLHAEAFALVHMACAISQQRWRARASCMQWVSRAPARA